MISTAAGISMTCNFMLANACASIRDNFESKGNVTDSRDSHQRKADSQIFSTEAGIQINVNELR
jgi:hypothetical protein